MRTFLIDFIHAIAVLWCAGNMLYAWKGSAMNAPVIALVNIVGAVAALWAIRSAR
jgi:hypothetical protein